MARRLRFSDLSPRVGATWRTSESVTWQAALSRGVEPPTFDDLVASSPEMKQVFRLGTRAAQSDIPVLIEGESGSGKTMTAHAIMRLIEYRGGVDAELVTDPHGVFATRDPLALFEFYDVQYFGSTMPASRNI